MPVIYVSDPVHDEVLTELAELGELRYGYGPDKVRFQDVQDTADAVLLRTETFSRAVIDDSPKLKIIARHGIGKDNVDIEAATDKGVWVTTTPGRNSRSVAEHVFALLCALARKIPSATAHTRAGYWSENKTSLTGIELHGRVLGLLGLGSIGSLVQEIAQGFGMKVLVTDPAVDEEHITILGGEKVDFDELVAAVDMLSLHIPLTASTSHIINETSISRMRRGAFLINTARGGLVDEAALVDALRSGQLAGAALDVLEAESVDMKNPVPHNSTPMAELPNLVVTPHLAGQTDDSLRAVGLAATASIRQALAGLVPDNAVNTDSVSSHAHR